MHERSNESKTPARDRALTSLDDLVRGVGDDSPPKDKTLFTLWAGLQDIANDFPNHRAASVARQALERAGKHLVDKTAAGTDAHPVETWPTSSCCGEPRVTPAVDRCYDHATACRDCGQPTESGQPMESCCARADEPGHNTEGGGHA
ncbi:MAG: hypothetical protein JHD16_00225 [Solirubrobacteraceae bacterium]|nr:hypothetical protein [Solirubrobacteraceae bacterium]